MPYRIEYTTHAQRHLRDLTAGQRALVVERVGEQLRHQPTVPTRNRKRLVLNALAAWELRVERLRVFYNVFEEPEPVVEIQAIGTKVRNKVFIQGEEVQL